VGEVWPAETWETTDARWYKTVFRGTYEELCEVREKVCPRYDEFFEFCASSPTLFEMQAKDCTKATGVAFVKRLMEERLGRPLTVVAIGDQENDLPMLAAAHLSACPDNSLDVVKATAKLHLCHHGEGAVAELIEYLDKQLPKV
jgi:hydroxymethylpyrimidine pyrophosphatase-like HAD family hydrolase